MALPLVARVGLMAVFREGMMWKGRNADQKRLTEWAEHRAEETGRKLVVLERGDDIHAGSIPVPDDSAVVLVLYAFEYVKSLPAAWNEVLRAAGSVSNVFVAFVPKASFLAWFRPGANYVLDAAPPSTHTMAAREVWRKYPTEHTIACQGKTRPFCFYGKKPYGS